MEDKVFLAWLRRQQSEGQALADQSDILDLTPLYTPWDLSGAPELAGPSDPQAPATHYVARFCCRGLVQRAPDRIEEGDVFEAGITFLPDYLRRVEPASVVQLLQPIHAFHPNIRWPFVCLGHIAPGTGLVDLLTQVHEILTWQKVTIREDDALNPVASAWARSHPVRFPVDVRPLKRRAVAFRVEAMESGC